MTKNKANSTIKWLDVQCDDYIFATRVGVSGSMSSMRINGDWTVVLAFLISLIGDTLARLKKRHYDAAHHLILAALLEFMKGEAPEMPKDEEQLSDKQRKKRIKANERILAELEAIL